MIQKIQEHLEENLRKTKGIRETDENSGRYTYLFRIQDMILVMALFFEQSNP